MHSTSATMIMPSEDHARAAQDSDVPPHELITCVRLTRIRLTKLTKSDETETLKLKGKDRPTDSETKTKNRVMVTSWSRSPEIAST